MAVTPEFCSRCAAPLESRLLDGRMRQVCPACGTVFYCNPLPVACALVLNDKREVLLVKRRDEPDKGMWCLPIGFAEQRETIAEAALRELREEAGIEGRVIRLLDVDTYSSDFYGDLLIVTFEVEKTGGREAAGDDAVEAVYFPLEKLPPLAFPANDRAVEACREAHREEWAIRESFRQLEATAPSDASAAAERDRGFVDSAGRRTTETGETSNARLLSDALVLLIRDHAGEISRAWLSDVRSNATTPGYRELSPDDLSSCARQALEQFGRWLTGEEDADEVRAFYRGVGARRREQGLAAEEVLSSLMLLKKQVWTFAHDRGMWERAIDVYRVLELDRRLVLFFDRAMYHELRGWSDAPRSEEA